MISKMKSAFDHFVEIRNYDEKEENMNIVNVNEIGLMRAPVISERNLASYMLQNRYKLAGKLTAFRAQKTNQSKPAVFICHLCAYNTVTLHIDCKKAFASSFTVMCTVCIEI